MRYMIRTMNKLLVGLIISMCCTAFAQTKETTARFEAASIKPTTSASGVTGGCRGIDSKIAPTDARNNVPLGRCVITAGRLSHLMSIAFDLPLQRISGFPDWDGPNRFDIQAKAEDPSTASDAQLYSMLQAFMTERFKLTLHREIKEMPIFSLVASKGGLKNIHPSEQIGESMTPQGASLVFKGYTMQNLAEFLSMMPGVGRPVRDMTGIQGRFDFALNVLAAKPENIENVKMAIAAWETIFSDVQEQLGLRLESTKGSVENLIIDHAEKPSEN
jgi:uncharacterized protein (TIGR03435 family)